jgi:3'-5' exoribonuclease
VRDLDKVVVSGKIRDFNGGQLATLSSFQPIKSGVCDPLQIIPSSVCPEPLLLGRIQKIYGQFSNETLKQFIALVFSDDAFALPFITVPASWNHHYSKAGGLLEHSLQCAEMVMAFKPFMEEHNDLGVVAALLHDAGKIVTHNRTGKPSPASWVLDHNALTLEVLAPCLKKLDSLNPDMATALRYIWTWRHHRKGSPPYPDYIRSSSSSRQDQHRD